MNHKSKSGHGQYVYDREMKRVDEGVVWRNMGQKSENHILKGLYQWEMWPR